MIKNKNILKKCSCGTEELMSKPQKRCQECIVKAKNEKFLRSHCLTCGRYSRYLKDGFCKFCFINPKMKIKEVSKAVRCANCGRLVGKAENLQGFCKSCYQNKDVVEFNQRLLEKWETF
jgi:uncharacterized OB-fold protein